MNNLEKIYEEFGNNICLFPFMAGFYSTSRQHTIRPCSLATGEWNIENNSILDTINNATWTDLRENFIQGSCHTSAICTRCSAAETAGGDSARQLNNRYFADNLQIDIIASINNIIANNYITTHIASLDYMPSNYCDYACIMCSGGASTRRGAFEIKVYSKTKEVTIKNIDIADDFYQILNGVELLNFTGGETILQKQVHTLIEYLIAHDLAKNITITMLTNASTYPTKLIEQFTKFKNIFYTISIDGIGDVIEYQRRGASWSTVEANATQLWNSKGCVVNYVLTAVNVFRFTEFLAWAYNNKINRIFISMVFNVDYLSVAVIPVELKTTLIYKLEEEKMHYTDQYYIDLLNCVITILNNIDANSTLLPRFIKHIRLEDTASKKTLVEVVPEWAPYFG